VQASGNHQVQDQPEIIVQSDRDSLANSSQFTDGATFNARKWRFNSAQKKRAPEADVLKRLLHDPLLERSDVRSYVRKFRHDSSAR
jgi:hypothetical protein